MIRPRCEAAGCNEPTFYVPGKHCLAHIKNPPRPSRPARRPEPPTVDVESESSD